MYGFPSMEAAIDAYKSQYEDGWKVGTVTEVSREDFKKWVESSTRKTKPFSEYVGVKTNEAATASSSEKLEKAEERRQTILNGGTNYDSTFGLTKPSDIKTTDELSANVDNIIDGLAKNEGEPSVRDFEGFAYGGKYADNAVHQVYEYLLSLSDVSKDLSKVSRDFLNANNIKSWDDMTDYVKKRYNIAKKAAAAQQRPSRRTLKTGDDVLAEVERRNGFTTDQQGNPVDNDGKLIKDKVSSIDEITEEDFINPTRTVELPKLPNNVDAAIGANGKPVIIKKNIFEKNAEAHQFEPSESRSILKEALYNTDLVGQTQPSKRPNHWVAIKIDEESPITVLEVNENKDNVEVVGWYRLDDRNLGRIKRQAEREGGELLILTPKGAAASLSTLPRSSSSERKDKQSSSKKQGKSEKKNEGQFGLVSDERMEELKKRLRAKLNNLNIGVDPEVLAIGLELTAGYIDRGVKKFADYGKAMIADLGDVVRPYLKAFYNGVRGMPEITSNGLDAEMDDYETVSKFNVATIGKEGEEVKPSILETAEQVSNEQTVQRQATPLIQAAQETGHLVIGGVPKTNHNVAGTENWTDETIDGLDLSDAVKEKAKQALHGSASMTDHYALVEARNKAGETKAATQRIKEMMQGGKTSIAGKKKADKKKRSQKKSVTSQQKQPSLFGDLFGDEETQPTEQEAEPSLFDEQLQEPVTITTDDEQGKEKPVEKHPAKELSGESKEYQERAQVEKEFVDRIKGMITDAVKEGRSLTMTDIKKAYKDELNDNWELPQDYKDTDLQELVERAMTLATREVAISPISNNNPEEVRKGYDEVVRLYETQPSLNARDSSRIAHQQYSTPTPFGYVMDWFLRNGNRPLRGLEPSAGNGALTIGFPAALWHVNDIDERRLMNLRTMPYQEITNQDGTLPFEPKAYDMVATNPPFGTTDEKEFDGGRTRINSLEGLMAINALASMKDNGRAAIIIGGNTQYMPNGAMQSKDMKLFRHLYTHYNVVDVINLDGDMYKRNGTGYNVRMILIAGRKTDVSDNPEQFTFPPVRKKARAEQVKSFDELYN